MGHFDFEKSVGAKGVFQRMKIPGTKVPPFI